MIYVHIYNEGTLSFSAAAAFLSVGISLALSVQLLMNGFWFPNAHHELYIRNIRIPNDKPCGNFISIEICVDNLGDLI